MLLDIVVDHGKCIVSLGASLGSSARYLRHNVPGGFVQHLLLQGELVDVGHVHDVPFLVESYFSVDDLLDGSALLGAERIAVPLETAGHELGNHGRANEVGIGFRGRRPALVASHAGLTDAEEASKALLREPVSITNALNRIRGNVVDHDIPLKRVILREHNIIK